MTCPRTGHPLRCACGAWAHFGQDVKLRAGQLGTWLCHSCHLKAKATP